MGRDIGYTMSKAALNMVTVKLAVRLGGDGVAVVAPPGLPAHGDGWDPRRPRPGRRRRLDRVTVDGLTLDRSGSFLRWDGTIHPW